MINAVNETMTQKTIAQYKIIEDKYLTLKRYLTLYFKENTYMTKNDIELIIKALGDEPLEIITRLYGPDGEIIEEIKEEETNE